MQLIKRANKITSMNRLKIYLSKFT